MKCLEKERDRRYETANGLAMDIQRHLDCEPVVARPPSRWYEFQKTVRRHKFGFAAGGMVTASLVLGLGFSMWQVLEKNQAYQRATEAEANEIGLRKEAEAQALISRQRAYASDMNVVKQAVDGRNIGRARGILDRYRPEPDERDLRGWEWRYLWDQTRSDAEFDLCQRPSQIISLDVSRDSRWLAIGQAHQGGVEIRNLASRTLWARLSEDEERVQAAFSPTGPLLAYTSVLISDSGERTSTLHLWNVETREMRATFPLDAPCVGLAFSEDGRTLVTSTSSGVEGHITLWPMANEEESPVIYPSQQYGWELAPSGFAVTRDLKLAAYALPRERIHLVDLRDGRVLWSPVVAPRNIVGLAFSPDGRMLATASGFGWSELRLWDVESQTLIRSLDGHTAFVPSLEFTPDGSKLVGSCGDQRIYVWEVATGKLLDVLHGHRQEVWRVKLLPDGQTLVSGAKDGLVSIWDVSVNHPRRPRHLIPTEVKGWSFAADSQSVLTLDWNGRVDRWGAADFQERETLLQFDINSVILGRDSISNTGNYVATGSSNGVVQVWNLARREVEHQFTDPDGGLIEPVQFGRDDRILVTLTDESMGRVWDLPTGRLVASWPKLPGDVNLANAAPDNVVVEVGLNGWVRPTTLPGGHSTLRRLNFLEVESSAFSRDAKLFVVASMQGYARVWEVGAWEEKATLSGFLLGLDSVAFSPDDRRVATGGGSNPAEAMRLWDVESWLDVLTLECEGSHFVRTKFSADGHAIGMMDTTRTLNIWRAPSWEEIEAAESATGSPLQEPPR